MIDPGASMVEQRGYGRDVGHFVMPNGSLVAVSHEWPMEVVQAFVTACADEWQLKGNADEQ